MGKGAGDTQKKETALSQQQIDLAKGEQAKGNQLFGVSFPGFQKAEDYYKLLSSGDHDSIMRAIAPATEQIRAASDAAKTNIMNNMPRGGEQRLASETADISAASQIGHLATQAYTSSFPALAALSGQGIGLNVNEMANAISGMSGASNTLSNVGQQQAAGKAATMGFLGSLAGAGDSIGGGFAAACWIARKLFGENTWKTRRMRYWVNHVLPESMSGTLLHRLYCRFGEDVAAKLDRNPRLRWIMQQVFEYGFARAQREVIEVPLFLVEVA